MTKNDEWLCQMEVVNISKKNLNKLGYDNLEHWLKDKNHIYIGRNMSFYVKGALKSKWHNPYNIKIYSRDKCLELYQKYIIETDSLYSSIEELKGMKLGCWCSPEKCHGDILIAIFEHKNKLQ